MNLSLPSQALVWITSRLENARQPLVFVVLVLYLVLRWTSFRSWRSKLPPGPPAWPIVGHLPIFPQGGERFKVFQGWHAQYGDLFSLRLGSKILLVLGGDGTLIRELMDKRGAIYSSRPRKRFVELLDNGENIISERDNAKWRVNRKLLAQHFGPLASARTQEEHVPIIEAESCQLLFDLLKSPEQFMEHPIRFASSVMTSIVYGVRGPTYRHQSVTGIETIMNEAGDLNALVPPLDAFPFLEYLPDFIWPWRDLVRRPAKLRAQLYKRLANQAKERTRQGLNRDSFARRVFEFVKEAGPDAPPHARLTEQRQSMLLATVAEGGSDIVANNILSALMALVTHPRVLHKARDEIDAMCDEETMPRFQDWERLRYIRMIVKESLRWRPPFPWGVLHSIEEDDTWNGFVLPKDSTVLINIWDLNMNGEKYHDPSNFCPERFEDFPLSSAQYMNTDCRDHYSFGAGRRQCPGSVTAELGIFISLARIIWAFDLRTPDDKPLNTTPDTAFVGANIRRPVPFKLCFNVRSSTRSRIIEKEMATAEDMFSRFGVSDL